MMHPIRTSQTHKVALVSALSALLALGSAGVAFAQQNEEATQPAEPTAEQLRLNSEAVGAITKGDYPRAIKLLEAANALGEFNVTWLNLGRAYQKMGACKKARQAYLNVISSPAVKDPSPRLINAKADQYLSELDDDCEVADDAQHKMAKGEEEPSEESSKKGKDGGEVAQPTKPAEPAPESSNVLGYTLTATGLVLAGAGVGTHFWAESIRDNVNSTIDDAEAGDRVVTQMSRKDALADESKANTLDTVGVSAIAVGAVVTGAGLFFVFSSNEVEAAPAASVTADGDVSVGLTGRF